MADTKQLPDEIAKNLTAFDQSKLKHTETDEKNPLPTKEGEDTPPLPASMIPGCLVAYPCLCKKHAPPPQLWH